MTDDGRGETRSVTAPALSREDGRPGGTVACPVCDDTAPIEGDPPPGGCPVCGEVVVFDGGDDTGDAEPYAYEPAVADPPAPGEQEFGRRGWLLVVAIVLGFLVIPVTIYLNAANVIALPFRLAFLALPMVPAVVLAVLAVWVTTTE